MKSLWVLGVLSLTAFCSSANAFNLSDLHGGIRQQFTSPNRLYELCVVPKKWQGGDFKNGDIKKEVELCTFDFYTNMGICPKYSSTNPGILLIKPTSKHSKTTIDSSHCDVDVLGYKTEAKFKQTFTCSSTPSILAYYQLSRLLGDINQIPVSVIRTMDAGIHRRIVDKANKYLKGSGRYTEITWKMMEKVHLNPRDYPALIDDTHTQIYGALSDNVKNEEKYTEISGKGSYSTRYTRFLSLPPFLRLTETRSVTDIVGSSEFAKVAQTVVQMKDIADMILLDTLLNQQDRIGNIHYKFYWMFVDPSNNSLNRQKSEAKWKDNVLVVPEAEKAEMAGKQAALVKQMVLKDNDCGVTKTNMMRKLQVLQRVNHFSYRTYRKFLAFEQTLQTAEAKEYFKTELLFGDKSFQSLLNNAKEARQILKGKCERKELRFDLDLERYVPNAPALNPQC
ncbi:hypothetical protein ACES2L_05120 [Bdellovibrio bacteriovorus]